MELNLSAKEFRRLLDLCYIGNWILNSCRGSHRFQDYDALLSKLFSRCPRLSRTVDGVSYPSQEYVDGGIHQAISCYEDTVFYEILSEELSRRDMEFSDITEENDQELSDRMQAYMEQFELYGVEHLYLEDPSS